MRNKATLWPLSALALAPALLACSDNKPADPYNIPVPQVGTWADFGTGTGAKEPPLTKAVDGKWSFAFPAKPNNSVNMVYTKPSALATGRTIKLTYSIDGDATFGTVDGGNPTLRLFLWRAGDDLSCAGAMASYRFWHSGVPLRIGDNQTLSAQLDPTAWTNCFGAIDIDGFAAAVANAQYSGFTFGGQFAAHGVWTLSGSAVFRIKSYTVQ